MAENRSITFVEILQKALNEHDFATRIVADPSTALKEMGVDPTPEKIEAIRNASEALLSAQSLFDFGTRNI